MGFLNDINKIVETVSGTSLMETKARLPDIDHPLARKTSWGCNRGGGKYKVNLRLMIDSDLNQLKTGKVLGRLVLGGIFFTVGGLFIYAAIIDTGVNMDWPALIVGGLLSLGGGIAILAFFKNWGAMIFDKTKGEWWIGAAKETVGSAGVGIAENTTSIVGFNGSHGLTKDIGAVQVLNEWVRSSRTRKDRHGNSRVIDDSHTSFELNLVFNDGSRKTLQDSRFSKLVKNNAAEIGKYLDVPVWYR